MRQIPLTESVPLEAGRTYTAGTDFPEGVYDISGSDWVTVDYKVYLGEIYDEEDLNYQWENVWFGEEPEVYCNAVLPAGTEITAGRRRRGARAKSRDRRSGL